MRILGDPPYTLGTLGDPPFPKRIDPPYGICTDPPFGDN